MSWPRHSSTEGYAWGLGRETELREPVLQVEVEPVARDNPVLDRHDAALADVAIRIPANSASPELVRAPAALDS